MADDPKDNANPPVKDPRALEGRIRNLGGVLSSRVIVNREGEIIEIHVVAAPGRHPKRILRDIETTLLADEGIRVDRRKVSIAQLEESLSDSADPGEADEVDTPAAPDTGGQRRDPLPSPSNGSAPRLRFAGIRTSLTPTGGEVEVSLARENLQASGKASFALSSGSERAVAEATVRAVERFIRDGRFEVLGVENRPVGIHRGVFVHVEFNSSGRVVPLIGSALVHRDLSLAALNATLDAVNRFVGGLPPAEGTEWVIGPEPLPGNSN